MLINFRWRLPLLALAGVALWAGIWAGLTRLGWRWPPLPPATHGPLMISGFLGTLISLERAVTLPNRWSYLAPLLSGLGGLALLVGWPFASSLSIAGSLGLVVIFIVICRLQLTWAHVTMGLGAVLWCIGNLLWGSGQPLYQVAPWWVGFLVLTIAGERLELARLLTHSRKVIWRFALMMSLISSGLIISRFAFVAGIRVGGVGLMALGFWLLRYDLALRTIRKTGLTRFIAACLLPGYVWLMVAGGLWVFRADAFIIGPAYDAMLHALLLGFVFSMIFGHAPIILPALLQRPVTYHPVFYGPLAVLHLSLLFRLSGDLWLIQPLRLWAGLFNALAIGLFLGCMVWAVRQASHSASASE